MVRRSGVEQPAVEVLSAIYESEMVPIASVPGASTRWKVLAPALSPVNFARNPRRGGRPGRCAGWAASRGERKRVQAAMVTTQTPSARNAARSLVPLTRGTECTGHAEGKGPRRGESR